MNTKKHRRQAIWGVMLMLGLTAFQWYLFAATGLASPSVIMSPACAVFIGHAGFFPKAWLKSEEDEDVKQKIRWRLGSIVVIVAAFSVGFANLWLMRVFLK